MMQNNMNDPIRDALSEFLEAEGLEELPQKQSHNSLNTFPATRPLSSNEERLNSQSQKSKQAHYTRRYDQYCAASMSDKNSTSTTMQTHSQNPPLQKQASRVMTNTHTVRAKKQELEVKPNDALQSPVVWLNHPHLKVPVQVKQSLEACFVKQGYTRLPGI